MKRFMRMMIAFACGSALFLPGPTAAANGFFYRADGLIVSVRTAKPFVALSFDDGPDVRFTPQILEILARARAHATFFVQGEHARALPDLVRAIAAGGNEIGNHTDDHPDVRTLAHAQLAREIALTDAAIRAAGATPSTLFRPPKGLFDTRCARAVSSFGYRSVGWTAALERFLGGRSIDDATDALMSRMRPGAIVVAHDGRLDRSSTVRALPALLAALSARGYEVVTIGTLLASAQRG